MAACEDCWKRAQWRVFLSGGSVVERYQELIKEPFEHAHADLVALRMDVRDA